MYELSYLISEKISENNLEKFNQEIAEEIKKNDGAIVNEIKPFKRKLTYPIKKHAYSFFKTFYFNAPEDKIKVLTQKLNLNDNIIRHIILKSSEILMKEYIERQVRFEEENSNNIKREQPEEKVEQQEKKRVDTATHIEEETPVNVPEKDKEILAEKTQTEVEEKETNEEEVTEKPVAKIKKESSKQKEKIKLEDIDKKIDEILNKTEI